MKKPRAQGLDDDQRRQQFRRLMSSWEKGKPIPAYLLPEEFQGLTCGARSKRTGEPCKRRDLFRNARCKFHGGASTGRKTGTS